MRVVKCLKVRPAPRSYAMSTWSPGAEASTTLVRDEHLVARRGGRRRGQTCRLLALYHAVQSDCPLLPAVTRPAGARAQPAHAPRHAAPLLPTRRVCPGRHAAPLSTRRVCPGRHAAPVLSTRRACPGRHAAPLLPTRRVCPGRHAAPLAHAPSRRTRPAGARAPAGALAQPARAPSRRTRPAGVPTPRPRATPAALRPRYYQRCRLHLRATCTRPICCARLAVPSLPRATASAPRRRGS